MVQRAAEMKSNRIQLVPTFYWLGTPSGADAVIVNMSQIIDND
jgi:hypothetical protein